MLILAKWDDAKYLLDRYWCPFGCHKVTWTTAYDAPCNECDNWVVLEADSVPSESVVDLATCTVTELVTFGMPLERATAAVNARAEGIPAMYKYLVQCSCKADAVFTSQEDSVISTVTQGD